ncbi:MAG: DUF3341 domain-containing protein [Acidobacteriaceae bacterium]|nr:DUF3341 domain-containing protein [Acidobacteriaceae bacterium]
MANKNTAVFGIYATPGTAEAAVDHLTARGFSHSAISVLLPDDESTRAFAHEKSTKAPEGTTTGATTGGVVGGTLGLLTGLGLLAIPGLGPLIAAGPIVATLAGVGAGGAVGGIVGALVGMGIPEYEAKRYEGAVKDGGTLLSVHCDTSEQIDLAKEALKETGARDISSTGETGSKDTEGARGTYGNIADGERVTDRTDRAFDDEPVVADDRRAVERDPVTGEPVTKRYGT